MFTTIVMWLLKIYLWGAGVIIGLSLLFGGTLLIVVKTTGKKPTENSTLRTPGIFSEFLVLLCMAAFFGFLWPYVAMQAMRIIFNDIILRYIEDIKKHNAKKNNAP